MKGITPTIDYYLIREQARAFEFSANQNIDSAPFITAFMNSETAREFDLPWAAVQGFGATYLVEDVDKRSGILPRENDVWYPDVMHWIGFIYRHWHFMTGQSSKEIFKIADGPMLRNYYCRGHILDPDVAVEEIMEMSARKNFAPQMS